MPRRVPRDERTWAQARADCQPVRDSTTGMKPVSIVPQSVRSFQPLCKESFLSFLFRLILSLQIETNERLGEPQ